MWKCSGLSNSEMVSNLVKHDLVPGGSVVESSMLMVDRALFCPAHLEEKSSSYQYGPYQDAPQALGWKSTISAPSVHAVALTACADVLCRSLARPKVLDVGAGSGIMMAYFLAMNRRSFVAGVEVVRPLVAQIDTNLKKMFGEDEASVGRWTVCHGDGWRGMANLAPFDVIHVGACADGPPQSLIDQLSVGGRLIIPIGKHTEQQQLMAFDKMAEGEIVVSKVGCKNRL